MSKKKGKNNQETIECVGRANIIAKTSMQTDQNNRTGTRRGRERGIEIGVINRNEANKCKQKAGAYQSTPILCRHRPDLVPVYCLSHRAPFIRRFYALN